MNSCDDGGLSGGVDRLRDRHQITMSVALCTYNGERFLREQLDSISRQTRPPDELVLCDDGSTDQTVAIAQEFAHGAPFDVRIFVNDRNLGSSKNFERAISLCKGDIIVPCDQDDVWLPEKLGVLENVFVGQPDVQLVFADAQIVDEELRPLGYTLWDAVRFLGRERAEVETGGAIRVLLRHNVVQGAGMAFRATLRPIVLPVPEAVVHDGWIALLASALGSVRSIERVLALYRQHGANEIGVARPNVPERMRRSCEAAIRDARMVLAQYERALERLQRMEAVLVPPGLLQDFTQKIAHVRRRISVSRRESGWLALMFFEILRGRYHRYSVGWWSVGHDLIKCSLNRSRTERGGDSR